MWCSVVCRGLTSHSTHYRSFRGRFLHGRWPNQQCQSTEGNQLVVMIGLNPTKTTPPCYNNTTLGNCLYAQRKGPNVINPICLTWKNCSRTCSVCCWLWTLCHMIQHRAVLIIFPLNLQTITITRMLSNRGEGRHNWHHGIQDVIVIIHNTAYHCYR